ncbi:mucin-2-like [Musca domestica]|uniref:Mucin-2-like n=1 Tax=Musca domestica TaxID=7370 RepID=A0ABM3VCC7_MUSDO|nr:mucin-2-like [Musca domestica]
MKFLLNILLLAIALTTIDAYCDVCQQSNEAACRSRNTFSLCVDGVLMEEHFTCPNDYVCTSGENICYPPDEETPVCPFDAVEDSDAMIREGNQCGICDEDRVFACLSETTYGFCFGKESILDGPVDLVMDCPANTVCNINYKADFCYDDTLAKASCVPSSPDEDNSETTTYEPETTTTSTEFTTTTKVYSTTTELPATTTTEVDSATTEYSTTTEEVTTTTTLPTTTTTLPTTTTTTEVITETTTSSVPTTNFTPDEPTTETNIITTTQEPITETTTMVPTTTTTTTTTTEKSTTRSTLPDTTKEYTTEPTTIIPSSTTTTGGPTTGSTTLAHSTTTSTTTEQSTTESSTTVSSTTTTEASSSTATTTTVTTTTTTPTPTEPRDPNQLCQDEGSTGFFKPDLDPTCTKYIMCYGVTLQGIEKTCPTGQYFDGERKFCTVEKPSDCKIETSTTTTKNPGETETSTSTTTDTNPNPETTTTTTVKVPTTTSANNQESPTTTTQATITNPPRDPKQICLDAGASGSYKYDGDCTKFVMCYILNGTLDGMLKSCPAGQYFHEDTKLCVNVKPDSCL